MCELEIHLDTREKKLIQSCKELVIPYKISNLSLGDIQVRHSKSGKIAMMIERKTWKDLAASILDNRYKEQHARYVAWAAENRCAVWYILEGAKRFRTPAQEKRTLSAHVSLCFDNHVKLVETKHPTETMEWIHRIVSKIHTKGTHWLQSGFCVDSEKDITNETASSPEKELARQKMNKIGKKTHSIRSTWMAMLSCLYGMSIEKADAVIQNWNTIEDLKQFLQSNDFKTCVKTLKSIKIPSTKRAIGPVLAKRIYEVFCISIVKKE